MRGRASALTLITIASSIAARAQADCADGVIDPKETCDDGNSIDADGCNGSCQIEAGYACSGTPSACCFQDAASAYALLADAALTAEQGIVTLTPEATWKEGTAWYRRRLDFTNPFTISVRLYLGTRDGAPNASSADVGADGGSLIFHRDARAFATKGAFSGPSGEDGGELGAKGITPVLGVEFDTYSNGAPFGDVTTGDEDHTSVFQGGTQVTQLASAVCMNQGSTCANFEDGAWHRFDVSWSGNADHHLRVSIDGNQRIDLDRDLVRDVFDNDPKDIIFGFAANTGGYYNLQRFCPLAPAGFGVPRDADADLMDDAVDADSDGDGRSDAEESANAFGASDPDADHDADGVPDYRDTEYWSQVLARASDCADVLAPIGACDALPGAVDFDRDGLADHLDLDSDGDGTADTSDPAPRDPCLPAATSGCAPGAMDGGVLDASVPPRVDASVAGDAGKPVEGPSPGDVDGDQVANEVDPAPTDPCVPNRNALACASGDADGDKLNNAFECPGLRMCRDTDLDGVSDYADADSDGDRIPDATECPDANACPDADGDGTAELLQAALAKEEDGCALGRRESPWSALLVAWLLFSARTGSYVRSAIARACGGRRSLPWCRAARRRPQAARRSS